LLRHSSDGGRHAAVAVDHLVGLAVLVDVDHGDVDIAITVGVELEKVRLAVTVGVGGPNIGLTVAVRVADEQVYSLVAARLDALAVGHLRFPSGLGNWSTLGLSALARESLARRVATLLRCEFHDASPRRSAVQCSAGSAVQAV